MKKFIKIYDKERYQPIYLDKKDKIIYGNIKFSIHIINISLGNCIYPFWFALPLNASDTFELYDLKNNYNFGWMRHSVKTKLINFVDPSIDFNFINQIK